ncbi:MAG: DUF2505 domain-containing protein [Alcanivoracaceae bacterium]|jgi:hypothetical protein|nr:DUF2505 domain-containing protein [Alcanivoracaceae bacterium]
MNFQEKKSYHYPADMLLKVFSDKEYFLEKYARSGATAISVLEDVQTESGSRITISRDVQVDVPVPAFARKYVPHTITLIQSDSWDYASRTGHIKIRFKGMPAQINCAMHMEQHGSASTLVLNFTAKVQIPFVGNKLAEVLSHDLRAKFEKDSAAAEHAMELVAGKYL